MTKACRNFPVQSFNASKMEAWMITSIVEDLEKMGFKPIEETNLLTMYEHPVTRDRLVIYHG
jgi:hypothetical protein